MVATKAKVIVKIFVNYNFLLKTVGNYHAPFFLIIVTIEKKEFIKASIFLHYL